MTIGNNDSATDGKIRSISGEREEAQKLLERILSLDLQSCDLTVCLASTAGESEPPRFRRADLMQQAANEFREAIDAALKPWKKAQVEGNLILTEFQADSVIEEGVVEYLRLPDYQQLVEQIEPLHNFKGLERFEADEQPFIKGLRFYAIVIKPPASAGFTVPIYYYRWYSHAFLLSESAQHAIRWRRQQGVYDVIQEPVLLFDRHIDCFSCGERMYILQKHYFYTIFRFVEELKKSAERALDVLEDMDLIFPFERFKADCFNNNNKLLILSKIYHAPYLSQLTIADLEQLINDYGLPISVEWFNDVKKLKYNPRRPWDILKLLNDSIAASPLTDISYEIKGKSEIKRRQNASSRVSKIRSRPRSNKY